MQSLLDLFPGSSMAQPLTALPLQENCSSGAGIHHDPTTFWPQETAHGRLPGCGFVGTARWQKDKNQTY